jgi:transposase
MGKDAKYVIRLGVEERGQLQAMIDEGRGSKSVRKRARILLKADESEQGPGWTDERVAEFAEVGLSTVHRIRQRFVEEGFDAAVFRKSATNRRYRKLDGAAEARLVAEACSPPPKGRAHWTLKLLGDRLVELEIVESIGTTTVHRTLKKTSSSRGRKSNG